MQENPNIEDLDVAEPQERDDFSLLLEFISSITEIIPREVFRKTLFGLGIPLIVASYFTPEPNRTHQCLGTTFCLLGLAIPRSPAPTALPQGPDNETIVPIPAFRTRW